jgi:hypothetical protein
VLAVQQTNKSRHAPTQSAFVRCAVTLNTPLTNDNVAALKLGLQSALTAALGATSLQVARRNGQRGVTANGADRAVGSLALYRRFYVPLALRGCCFRFRLM